MGLERGPSGQPFPYSLYGGLFLIYSKMASGRLKNFQAKKFIFLKPIFSIPYHFICDHVVDYINMPWNLPLHTVWYL